MKGPSCSHGPALPCPPLKEHLQLPDTHRPAADGQHLFECRLSPALSALQIVNMRIRVLWPSMQKWYLGTIVSFNAATKHHAVHFKDGDQAEYDLRHEAVVWLNQAAAPRVQPKSPKTGGPQGRGRRPARGGSRGRTGSAANGAARGPVTGKSFAWQKYFPQVLIAAMPDALVSC